MSTIIETGSGSLEANGFHLNQMISLEVNRLLVDNANLRNTQFLRYAGSINGMGSDTIRVRRYGLGGYNSFRAAAAEDTDVSTVDNVTVAYSDVTVARQYLLRKISDLATMAGYGPDALNPMLLAADMAASYETRFAELTCAMGKTFTTIKGSSSVDFTVDLFFESIFGLETAASNKGADGPFAAVLHPKALTDLQDSLRNETSNAVSMMQATAEMLRIKGKGYMGNLFGTEVYRSSHVTEAGGAKENFFIPPNALCYADGVPVQMSGNPDIVNLGKVVVELDRTATAAVTSIIGHAYIGFAKLEDDRGLVAKCST